MLGWHISIYRQSEDGTLPASLEAPEGERLAVWQTGLGGLGWLEELVKAGLAIDLGGNGYPCRYTATAQTLLPRIAGGPPGARAACVSGVNDILTEKWAGRTVINDAMVAACGRDEWLIVEAWDES
jgi:hypothetical protein